MFTTKQAAEKLNVSERRIRQLCREGIIPAQKLGRDWIIHEKDLENISLPGSGKWNRNKKD